MSTAILCICMFIHEWFRSSYINVPAHTTAMQTFFFFHFLEGKGRPAGKGTSLSIISVHVPVTSLLTLTIVLHTRSDPDSLGYGQLDGRGSCLKISPARDAVFRAATGTG